MAPLQISRLLLNAVVLALLSACAGGGGGGGGGGGIISPPPPPPVGPPVFPPLAPPHAPGDIPNLSSAEFLNNWGPAGTNAQIAWQNGATGAGVIVGVIDDGIDPSHPELVGRISPLSTDIVAGRNALVTTQSHGSEISSLIAGNYNGGQTVGVAYDATILAVRADTSGGFAYNDLTNALDYAVANNVDVINFSLGGDFVPPQSFIDAIERATDAGVIIVVSAGNSGLQGASAPNYPGLLALNSSVSNGLIMVAGGLNPDGSVNPVSNPPGSTANWYITAPGWQIIVPDHGPAGPVPGFQTCGLGPNGDLCRIQGTSYASPHVTGAVALVMDAFPGLTPQQVVDLLFNTADDTGPAGTDSLNGRGRLNIGRAFQPVGPLASPLVAGMSSVNETTQLGVIGPAFGDGLNGNAALWSVAGFDAYGRTFPLQLADNWLRASAGPAHVALAPRLWRSAHDESGLRVQMSFADDVAPDSYRVPVDRADLQQAPTRIDADLGAGLSVSFAANGGRTHYEQGDAVGHLASINADMSLSLTSRLSEHARVSFITETSHGEAGLNFAQDARTANAIRASFDAASHRFDVTLGAITEEGALLGMSWADALGETPTGETQFTGLSWSLSATPDVRFNASAEYGVADAAQIGWLRVVEPLSTTAFSLQAERNFTPEWLVALREDGAGFFRFSISQPMRVEDGELSFMAPTATKYGRRSLAYEERSFAPIPSGRELRLGLGYNYFAGETLSAFGETMYVLEPGHIGNAEPEALLRLGIRVAN
ncbi:S8 family peptidase [Vitreimonas flagellata]|uniref:S8 family peptidase n=1 Tax=Vitreimonas flagellata TaxID=2560861 RepID=UPI001074F91B|nr:S8 family peptidase [Vitreimonas flagellata]